MVEVKLVKKYPGTLVVGKMGVVDGALVRSLREVRANGGPLWVSPTEAAFAPAIDLEDLRFVLARLECVDHVLPSPFQAPAGWRVVELPLELVDQARQALLRPETEDGPPPRSWTPEALLRDRPNPLVLLSGCFDLVHAGHVRLIEVAASWGAEPAVAALTSRGIRVQPKNTAGDRPLWRMADRLAVLEALRFRPRVLLFDGPDCLELIAQLRPDIWIKEARDRGREIVDKETRVAASLGAHIVWIDGGRRPSSTDIARQIRGGRVSTALAACG